MNLRQALAIAIQTARKSKNLTQEDFGVVSSRTYISSLERGIKSPTLDKLDEIASVMGIQPATLVVLAYSILAGPEKCHCTIEQVIREVESLLRDPSSGLKYRTRNIAPVDH